MLPSTLRGATRAHDWQDASFDESPGVAQNAPPRDGANPLRAYFDSVAHGRGIWKWLHYFDIYHRHFQKFIGKEVRVVEVGIYSGGSLDMWKAYFGPKCRIYGVDIEQACKAYEDERTRVFIGDQGDREFWKEFRQQVPDVDIVIDDGGHLPEQQIVTLEEMLPYLRRGGVYLCEDITGEHNRFAAYLHGLTAEMNAFAVSNSKEAKVRPSGVQRSIGSVHLYPFVAVVEKADRAVQEFSAPKHGTEWQPFFHSEE